MSDDQTQKRDELRRAVRDAEAKSAIVKNKAAEALEAATRAQDFAGVFYQGLAGVTDDSFWSADDWNFVTTQWRGLASDADAAAHGMLTAQPFIASANATAASTNALLHDSASRLQAFQPAHTHILTYLERTPLLDKTVSALQRLGLGQRRGPNRTPNELLDDARRALDRGGSEFDSGLALIPLREAIQASLAELLRRRPRQEPAPNTRTTVVSIGDQCARPGMGRDQFERMGDAMARQLNELSAGKQKRMQRQEVQERFNTALLIFSTFLEALDEACFRQ